MKKKKILWGICGIGLGHARRQLPLLLHYAPTSRISIFSYGTALSFLHSQLKHFDNIKLHEVSVPYWTGDSDGLDFSAAARAHHNQSLNFSANARAMELTENQIGRPDLVVSDYEPTAAQYSYAFRTPLLTLDQQSKYIGACVPESLAGTSCRDEVMRLGMFFPKAENRLACSFFKVEQNTREVKLIPPILDRSILNLPRQPSDTLLVLVYLSEQLRDHSKIAALMALLGRFSGAQFAVYLPKAVSLPAYSKNIKFYHHAAASFQKHLASCHGIIATAGHSLLSEAMYLHIPVLALPLKLYEQQMNAHIIHQAGFGLSATRLSARCLKEFLDNLPDYQETISRDHLYLLRANGRALAIREIDRFFVN